MSRWRGTSLPIFWQTLLLVLATLLMAQAVSIGLFLSLRLPRPEIVRIEDLRAALMGEARRYDPRLIVRQAPTPPPLPEGMVVLPQLTVLLAQRTGQPITRTLLYVEPDQRGLRRQGEPPVLIRHGEPIFFDGVIAAIRNRAGWRIAETPPRPLIGAWQRRSLLWFALSALLLLPFVWFFAQRLARPIRRFADAADRMGADPMAPRVAEEGPAELRVTAHALNRMQNRLQDYVAERTAMIGAIAHDLRTPLARVAFRIEGAPDPIRESVQADIEQMHAMIAATIGFVRGSTPSGSRRLLALDVLIGDMVAAERDVNHPVSAGPLEPVTVQGDPVAITRLFQNLIDNGVSYAGGVEITLSRGAGRAEVMIADRGPGVPEARLDRIFAPFERGDPSRNRLTGGIGLGLTIARSVAEQHGGSVVLTPREGGGMTAVVVLPAADT